MKLLRSHQFSGEPMSSSRSIQTVDVRALFFIRHSSSSSVLVHARAR